jgi:hypothetical protein
MSFQQDLKTEGKSFVVVGEPAWSATVQLLSWFRAGRSTHATRPVPSPCGSAAARRET